MSNDDPSKFEPEAIGLLLGLRAEGVIVVVVGAHERGDGAAGVHTLEGMPKYRERMPAKLRAIADHIERMPKEGPR